MDIGIGRGLDEARALLAAHWRALLVYTALGVPLPYALLGSDPIFSLRNIMAIAADPWTYQLHGSIAGPLYLLAIVAVLVAGAMLAAWAALFAEMREGYISEIMYGMVAGAAYLLANIILSLGVGLTAALPLFFIAGETFGGGEAPGIALELYRFVVSLAGSWIGVRFCLAGAIMGEGGRLEPVSAFAESWRRTRSAQWRLYGFYLLYGLIFGIAGAGLFVLHGAVIWNNTPGGFVETLMSLGWILLFAAYFLGQILIPAGLLRASQPGPAMAEVFA